MYTHVRLCVFLYVCEYMSRYLRTGKLLYVHNIFIEHRRPQLYQQDLLFIYGISLRMLQNNKSTNYIRTYMYVCSYRISILCICR